MAYRNGTVENMMVADNWWDAIGCVGVVVAEPDAVTSHATGYTEVFSGVFVSMEDAFDYALERVSSGTGEERQEFIDWFYSNWIKED